MKHIKSITKQGPTSAAAWQEFLCYIIRVVVDMLGATGGSLPILSYLDEKCPPGDS